MPDPAARQGLIVRGVMHVTNLLVVAPPPANLPKAERLVCWLATNRHTLGDRPGTRGKHAPNSTCDHPDGGRSAARCELDPVGPVRLAVPERGRGNMGGDGRVGSQHLSSGTTLRSLCRSTKAWSLSHDCRGGPVAGVSDLLLSLWARLRRSCRDDPPFAGCGALHHARHASNHPPGCSVLVLAHPSRVHTVAHPAAGPHATSKTQLIAKRGRPAHPCLLVAGFEFHYDAWDAAAAELCQRYRETP